MATKHINIEVNVTRLGDKIPKFTKNDKIELNTES